MIRISFFISVLVLLPSLTFAASSVIDLIPSNFDSVILQSGKPALVEFFAPWCGHCKNLAPEYEKLATNFAHASHKVVIAKVDADEHRDLGKRFGVQGFPTLKWFDGKSDSPEDYNGGRDVDALSAWVTKKTGLIPKAPQKNVASLDDHSFNATIGKEKNVLVAFVSANCIQCKPLLETWEALNLTFSREPNVLLAKFDTDAPKSSSTAKKQGISSYPSIKFFSKGKSQGELYSGGLSEKDFVDFINSKSNTFRLPGGGLNDVAGLVETLNDILKKGGNDVYEKIIKAAEELEDQGALYYKKVAEKRRTNKEYVEKELKRLSGMIKKGGVAPAKLDDLVYRSNILRKFKEAVAEAEPQEKSEL